MTFWYFEFSPTYKVKTDHLVRQVPSQHILLISCKALSISLCCLIFSLQACPAVPKLPTTCKSEHTICVGQRASGWGPGKQELPTAYQSKSNSGMTQQFCDLHCHFSIRLEGWSYLWTYASPSQVPPCCKGIPLWNPCHG